MDIFTHTLTGLALARAGAGRAAPYGTLALVMAANISDIDYAYALSGPLRIILRLFVLIEAKAVDVLGEK